MHLNHFTPGGLTDEQQTFFHEEGYLIVEDLLDEADLQPVIDDLTDEIDRLATIAIDQGQLSNDYRELDFEHRLAAISRETDQVALGMWNGALATPGIFGLLTNAKLLDVAESLCGEELIASSVYRLRPKIPHYHYGAVPWHQDSAYFEAYCDKALVLTVWTPLVDTHADNGCLWVVPRVHRQRPVLAHRPAEGKAYLEIRENELPAAQPVCCPVPKGGVLLMHNLTPHCSFENQTDCVRWSMDLRYQSAALPTNATISRLPGEAVAAGDDPQAPDFIPTACYPPERDFLVRSAARPNEVVATVEQFLAIRKELLPVPGTNRWGRWWEGEANAPPRD